MKYKANFGNVIDGTLFRLRLVARQEQLRWVDGWCGLTLRKRDWVIYEKFQIFEFSLYCCKSVQWFLAIGEYKLSQWEVHHIRSHKMGHVSKLAQDAERKRNCGKK